MSKKSFNYFDAFRKQAAFAEEIALNLNSGLENGELGKKSLLNALHSMENDADEVNHSIQERLVQDFTVPLERKDINELANALDDVCDSLEEIAIKAYIWNVSALPKGGLQMSECLAQGASEIAKAVSMFGNMKDKTTEIRRCCVTAQEAESRCDLLYFESARRINESDLSFEERAMAIEILEAEEDAMDTIETAAEMIERVLTSNI